MQRDHGRRSTCVAGWWRAALAMLLCHAAAPGSVAAQGNPSAPPAQHATLRVMTWGVNTAQWNEILGHSGTHLGCSGTPVSCMKDARSVAREQRSSRVFLSIPLRPDTAGYGAQYGLLSSTDDLLQSIGVDDFGSQYEKLFSTPGLRGADPRPAQLLERMITGAKSHNPRLRFGITLYEDDLDDRHLHDPLLPAAFRGRIDLVHLYLHYRANAARYEDYVEQVKSLFPRAKIIAGVYAYDRINYMPCSQAARAPCTPGQELDYFTAQLDTAIRLQKAGAIEAIEFYPGQFGAEEAWVGWNDPGMCPPRRRQDCVEMTKAMRRIVANRLH